MKKMIFLGSICLAFSTLTASAARVYVRKDNGGANGYSSIRESHAGDNHYLSCRNPGSEACKWEVQPKSSKSFTNLNNIVEGHISAGELSGSIVTQEGYSATWDGTNEFNVSIEYGD